MSSPRPWWRDGVVYQVYLRSFADGTGDGIGDIAGLRSRLGYIEDLGVDAIWVNPWYESPLNDGGYDITDYRSINPLFGTLAEARVLIGEIHDMGLRLLVDLVPNHTSSEHPWFKAALGSAPGSPERDRYHFREGKGPDGFLPPNDWRSVFGGPAWSHVGGGEWYLHLFEESQPDLNWGNPQVRSEFEDILRFWLDIGADGFRVDVAHALVKDPAYPDLGEQVEEIMAMSHSENHPIWDRPELHEIVRDWRKVLDEYPDTVMVAEAWVASWDRLARYLRPGEYHQAFDFLFLQAPWEPLAIRATIEEALTATAAIGAIPTWVLSNHDVVRHPTRYGLPADVDARAWLLDGDRSLLEPEDGLRRARAAVLLMLALPGSVYLYQGEELGLGEVHELPLEAIDDPVWARSGRTLKGRDGCRVPIPWTVGGPSHGFGVDGSWLPQPPGWGELSVEAQEGDPGSTLELYRKALQLRSRHLRGEDTMTWLDTEHGVLSFRRGGGLICMVNFGLRPVPPPDGPLLVASGELTDGMVPQGTAVWALPDPG